MPLLRAIVPRQRRCTEALQIINSTLDGLIQRCKDLVEEEDQEFVEEFVGKKDPSILHFLLASGDQVMQLTEMLLLQQQAKVRSQCCSSRLYHLLRLVCVLFLQQPKLIGCHLENKPF